MATADADLRYFSADYAQARERFREAATACGATRHTYDLNLGAPDALTLDVAVVGANHAPTLLLSSGVHGIEGAFGSAVQLALLERLAETDVRGAIRYVLVHAVNPYGFARLRRVNEDNVDLNRNFVLGGVAYHGAPSGYAALDALLNPVSPPSRWEPFRLKALSCIRRLGLQAIKDAVAAGQYEFPQGLFYGGSEACASTRIVQQYSYAWLADSPFIVHIDLHTGLGAHARHTLLLNETRDSPHYSWYSDTYGAHRVEPLSEPHVTAYRPSGPFGLWMQQHFSDRQYRFIGAEFGTYDNIRVLAALRAENRAHHYCARSAPAHQRAKRELLECFCPASPAWRSQTLAGARELITRSENAIRRVSGRRQFA